MQHTQDVKERQQIEDFHNKNMKLGKHSNNNKKDTKDVETFRHQFNQVLKNHQVVADFETIVLEE